MNNFEKIKQMTVDEMAEFLLDVADSYLYRQELKLWLLQEVEE